MRRGVEAWMREQKIHLRITAFTHIRLIRYERLL
jgi:hypothetical protein